MSNIIFSSISKNIFLTYKELSTLTTQILFHKENPLQYMAENTSNYIHLLDLLTFSTKLDSLGINLLRSIGKKILQADPQFETVVGEILNKSKKVLGLWNIIYQAKQANTNETLDFDELLKEVENDGHILIYELSNLQTSAPLLFGNFFGEFLEYVVSVFLEDWQSEILAKSSAFMLYKVLKTYIYYKGSQII